jgi:hypothetical protein
MVMNLQVMRGIYLLAEQLSASEEEICSMEYLCINDITKVRITRKHRGEFTLKMTDDGDSKHL